MYKFRTSIAINLTNPHSLIHMTDMFKIHNNQHIYTDNNCIEQNILSVLYNLYV